MMKLLVMKLTTNILKYIDHANCESKPAFFN